MKQGDVIKLFQDSKALLTGHFKLTSGRHSNIYYEKFALLKQPETCTKLCKQMAELLENRDIETVVGPTTGGIILAYDVARYLGVESIYAEPGEKGRIFKRGFSLRKGQKVAIVDDVLTTGHSVHEVIDLVNSYEAEIQDIVLMLDRSGGAVKFDYPTYSLASVSAESWEPNQCPLCAKGEPITQPGSRKF
ncbi:MAG: orotate phosphoribosyltransferase [candidate division Zixibacteria bacterium]|nr:orotate phosphoribosyltransferase [candidate division Zixibacteria bacterium]